MIAQLLREFAALFVVTDPARVGGVARVRVGAGRGPAHRGRAPAMDGGPGGASRDGTVSGVEPRAFWLLAFIVLAGAVIRFWGLGLVGLHGDEKTMALPVMNLVEHGSPLMRRYT
jgi:hypothetical protein